MKLFEYVGHKTYALVVAAETQEQAESKLRELELSGKSWCDYADEIRAMPIESDDIVNIRDLPEECHDLDDIAHIIASQCKCR